MSSGYFPLDKAWDENGKKLLAIKSQLDEISRQQHRLACEDLNGEDGVHDGRYIAYLDMASELIERCFK